MRKVKRGLSFLLTLMMVLNVCFTTSFAEEAARTEGHLTGSVQTEAVKVGDEFTVTLSMDQMTTCSYAGGLHFDPEYVEYVGIDRSYYTLSGVDTDQGDPASIRLSMELGELGEDLGMYFVNAYEVTYDAVEVLVNVTFKAKKEGSAVFNCYESTDYFDSDAYAEFTVKIEADEASEDLTAKAFTVVDGNGQNVDITLGQLRAAESVTTTEDAPWTYNSTSKAVGTFYSLKSILETAGVEYADAHGLKVVATDGFTSGFAATDIDTIYVYEQSEVTVNGTAVGEKGYGTAINGSAGNKWAKNVATIAVANDHVMFVKKGACKHYCSICGADEASVAVTTGAGTSVTVHDCEIRAAESVTTTEEDPWIYKSTNKAVGTFYSLKSILETAGVEYADAHGLKVVATDGFTSGFAAEDIENLYIYEQSEVTVNGSVVGEKGTYGTAINGSAGNKWAKSVATIAVADNHVMFVKNGACKHTCSICGEAEASVAVVNGEGTSVTVYDCQIRAAESVTTTADAPWTYNSTKEAVGTFYSLKSILETAGVEYADAHGLKVVATDGFTSGFASEDIDNIYVYEQSEVTVDGTAVGAKGTYGTAINGSTGNKWAKNVATIAVANDHVMFVKKGACKHYCSICGEDEDLAAEMEISWEESEGSYTAKALKVYNCGATEEVALEAEEEITLAADCENDGKATLKASYTYKGETVSSEQEVILPAKGHTPGEKVEKERKEATTSENGYVIYTVSCQVCNKVLSETKEILAKKQLKTPDNIKCTNTAEGVKVTFAASEGAVLYKVYRKDAVEGASYKGIGTTNTTSYIDKTAVSGKSYAYTVRCVTSDGKTTLSGYVKEGCTVLYLAQPAVKVENNTSNGVNVTWSSISGATGYYVYRKPAGGSYKRIATLGNVLKYNDSAAESGTTYYYTVRACNGTTLSSYNDTVCLTVLSVPVVTVAVYKENSIPTGITVKWTKVTGAKGYYVYRKAEGGTWSRLATVTSGTTVSYTDLKAVNGQAYYYTVRAYNGSYLSSFKSSSQITRLYLAQPTVKVENNTANGVNVSWNSIQCASGYYVYRKPEGGSYKRIATVNGALKYSDTGVESGKTYYYTVRAYNGTTLSTYVDNVYLTVLSVPVVTVSLYKESGATTGISVKWTKVTGAKGYYIYRKTEGGSWARLTNISGGTTVSYTDKTAKAGTKYYYTVRAVNGTFLSSFKSSALITR